MSLKSCQNKCKFIVLVIVSVENGSFKLKMEGKIKYYKDSSIRPPYNIKNQEFCVHPRNAGMGMFPYLERGEL